MASHETPEDLANYSVRPIDPSRPLEGQYARLEPLTMDHCADLYAATLQPGSESLWEFMSFGPFVDSEDFSGFIARTLKNDAIQYYAACDEASGRPSGMASFMRIEPAHGCIEIGGIWFGPVLQKTRSATEAIYLLAAHAFDDLGYRRLEWKCDAGNAGSRSAAARFGFSFEGIFRQHMIVKSKPRDTAWFAIIDTEWADIKSGFNNWLQGDNFNEKFRQRKGLKELMPPGA